MTIVYPIDDASRVAECRRGAGGLARGEGLDERLSANLALVVTEVCTNLVKHANGGEVFLSTLSDRFQPGVEILAIDRGPGMASVSRSLEDGYSSASTSGTGLGAIARMSQEFDVYSDPAGTVLAARIHGPEWPPASIGAVVKPIDGEDVSGDAWSFSDDSDALAIMVADGLGHGEVAARASIEAVKAFRRSFDKAPLPALQRVHGSLRGTRGAAVAVAYVEHRATVRYAGIGNITGALVNGGKPVFMVSHNGTAGYHSPRLQEFSYALPEEALIVMHSDGLHTNWTLDRFAGLQRRDPSVIAGVLYRDFSRRRDDVCVVVAKPGSAS